MDNLTDSQLEILSKVNSSPGVVNMGDLTDEGLNLDIPGWDDEMRGLFQKKLLEIDGTSYRLTPLGKEAYENYK